MALEEIDVVVNTTSVCLGGISVNIYSIGKEKSEKFGMKCFNRSERETANQCL